VFSSFTTEPGVQITSKCEFTVTVLKLEPSERRKK